MRRKHNPLLAVVASFLLAAILVLLCAVSAGCAATDQEDHADRITFTNAGSGSNAKYAYILTDTETGVQYLLVKTPTGTALTVLQPGEE